MNAELGEGVMSLDLSIDSWPHDGKRYLQRTYSCALEIPLSTVWIDSGMIK